MAVSNYRQYASVLCLCSPQQEHILGFPEVMHKRNVSLLYSLPRRSNLTRTWTQADFQSSNYRIVSTTSISWSETQRDTVATRRYFLVTQGTGRPDSRGYMGLVWRYAYVPYHTWAGSRAWKRPWNCCSLRQRILGIGWRCVYCCSWLSA